MKICLLSRFFDLRNAGIGRYSMELLKRLVDRGHDVIAVSQDGGIPLGQGRAKYLVYTLFEIRFKIPKGCDAYHALAPTEGLYLPKENSIVTFHDLIPWLHADEGWYRQGILARLYKGVGSSWFRYCCENAAARAKRIICNSEQTKKEVVDSLGVEEEKVRITRWGISDELRPHRVPHQAYIVGTLGYLERRKRIDLLIKAFKRARMTNAQLWIAGRGKDKERLVKLARGDERIKFLGFIPEERLNWFYNSLDVFVFPSKIEGHGLPIVEAMKCKVPVVILRDAIIPYDVKKHAHIVDEEDLPEFLRKQRFDENKIEEGYRFSLQYSWSKCVEQTEKIYEEVAQK
jgi:glycosyltransferase involved in cell wall biosynthesis